MIGDLTKGLKEPRPLPASQGRTYLLTCRGLCCYRVFVRGFETSNRANLLTSSVVVLG